MNGLLEITPAKTYANRTTLQKPLPRLATKIIAISS